MSDMKKPNDTALVDVDIDVKGSNDDGDIVVDVESDVKGGTKNEKAGDNVGVNDDAKPTPAAVTVEKTQEQAKPKAAMGDNMADTGVPVMEGTGLRQDNKRKRRFLVLLAVAVIALVVGLTVGLTRDKDDDDDDVPDTVNYETGVSWVKYYVVNATISSRLAQTKITMEIDNGKDCSSIHSVTMQLPLGTRVASLQTKADNGCITDGVTKKLEDARETFLEQAEDGLPGAYVEEQDSFTHSVQVAIPPLGSTKVELVLEALLQQRLGGVKFEFPFIPNEKVDKVEFELNVEDLTEEPVQFELDIGGGDVLNETSRYYRKWPDARQHDLPRIVHGSFRPSSIDDDGKLLTDGEYCFEHYFRPPSVAPMGKNILFLLDVSGSMSSNGKLDHAKRALKTFIKTLTPQDTFAIQTFANLGTVELWGTAAGVDEEKAEAEQFINGLSTLSRYRNTNLHEALLEALLRTRSYAEESSDDSVTVLVLLTDGWATVGETDRPTITQDVYKRNRDGSVKIFSLGFQGTDSELLSAIAIMNGGVYAPLLTGYSNYESQIATFFESQFGTVLLSDVDVKFEGDATVATLTQGAFPLLAEGYEVVVRGLLSGPLGSGTLKARTSATTTEGRKHWSTTAIQDESTSEAKNSRCQQSFAHDRITQLMALHEAAELIGDEFLLELASLPNKCTKDEVADCIEDEALNLALDGNIIVKGLTGMVTEDRDQCHTIDEEATICRDGTAADGYVDDVGKGSGYSYGDGTAASGSYGNEVPDRGYAESSSSRVPIHNLLIAILCIWVTLKVFY